MYQCAPPGGSRKRTAWQEADQAPLWVEDVQQRFEIVLVSAAAVREDERTREGLPPALGSGT